VLERSRGIVAAREARAESLAFFRGRLGDLVDDGD
jgi:hypothetical protein